MVRHASVIAVSLLALTAGMPVGLASQGPDIGRQPLSTSAHLGTPIFNEREIARPSVAPVPLQSRTHRERPSFLGAAIAAGLGATVGALLGASTQSLGAVAVGAWLGGAVGVSIITNDPMASLVGSAGGIAAMLLVADPSSELQIYISYASVTSLLARSAMP